MRMIGREAFFLCRKLALLVRWGACSSAAVQTGCS